VWRQVVQRRNVQLEFARLCEFSQASSHTAQIVPGDAGGQFGKRLSEVVDAVFLHAEDVRVGGAVDKVVDVAANVVGELFKETFLEAAVSARPLQGTNCFKFSPSQY